MSNYFNCLFQSKLESTYQKYLGDLHELTGIIQNNSEMWDMDLTTCDMDTLKYLSQLNMVYL